MIGKREREGGRIVGGACVAAAAAMMMQAYAQTHTRVQRFCRLHVLVSLKADLLLPLIKDAKNETLFPLWLF